MPPVKKNYRKSRSRLYWRRRGIWTMLGQRDYLVPLTADEFVHAWPALLQKRQQSSAPHPLPQDAHTNFSYGSEV